MIKKLCFVLALFGGTAAAQLPDAPTVQKPLAYDAHQSQYTQTWRQTLDWKFAAVHGVYLAAMLFDQHETLKGEAAGCALEEGDPTPYYAHRSDLMKKNMPFFAGITVVDALLRKAGVPIAWMAGPGVATVKHVQGGVHWIQLCH